MNEPATLQGYTWDEFNDLMRRLSKFSPHWANHIKIYENRRTINLISPRSKLLFKDRWYEGFKIKSEQYNLVDSTTCIVGETYNRTNEYSTLDEESCYDCELFSNDLYIEDNEYEDLQLDGSSITILEILSNYVKHLEDKHKNLIKEKTT